MLEENKKLRQELAHMHENIMQKALHIEEKDETQMSKEECMAETEQFSKVQTAFNLLKSRQPAIKSRLKHFQSMQNDVQSAERAAAKIAEKPKAIKAAAKKVAEAEARNFTPA